MPCYRSAPPPTLHRIHSYPSVAHGALMLLLLLLLLLTVRERGRFHAQERLLSRRRKVLSYVLVYGPARHLLAAALTADHNG